MGMEVVEKTSVGKHCATLDTMDTNIVHHARKNPTEVSSLDDENSPTNRRGGEFTP